MLGLRFGSVQSKSGAPSGYRYARLVFDSGVESLTSIFAQDFSNPANRFGFLTEAGILPAQYQTSATSPLVVTESSKHGENAGWTSLKNSFSGWVPLTTASDPKPWLQVDFGTVITDKIVGMRFISNQATPSGFKVYTSLTGQFAGEETLVGGSGPITWNPIITVQDFIF